jgi:glycosyltransferase involved in cell wall biosynthesis
MKSIYYHCPPLTTKIGGFGNVGNAFYYYAKKHNYNLDTINNNLPIGFMYYQPQDVVKMNKQKYKIGYCMFESTKCPQEWGDYLRQLNILITPSKFARDVFFNQFGIDSIVIPHGINTDEFVYQEREKKNTFKLVFYNAFDSRKGHTELLRAFMLEFSPKEDITLTLKTCNEWPSNTWWGDHTYMIKEVNGDIENRAEFLKNYDCMVFPSRGEGFGMTPLEAMATGIPAIIPNKHGIAEYFDSRYNYEIETYKDKAIYGRGDYDQHDLGDFEYPEIESIRKQMRLAYNDWKDGKNQFSKSKEISDYARQFSLEEATKKILAICDTITL